MGLALVLPACSGSGETTQVEQTADRPGLLPPDYPREREQVDASRYPWSAVGRVTAVGGRHTCTGVLVGERLVLTAAHCVWPFRGFPEALHFLAGFQRDEFVAGSRAKSLRIADGYRGERPSTAAFANDWAIIELEQPIGRHSGWLGWGIIDQAMLDRAGDSGIEVSLSGYRGDRRYVQTVDHDCRISSMPGHDQLFIHECPIMPGDSGGPLILQHDKAGFLVAGIDVGGVAPARERDRAQAPTFLLGYAVSGTAFVPSLERLSSGTQWLAGPPRIRGRRGGPAAGGGLTTY